MIKLNHQQVADILTDQCQITDEFTFEGLVTDSREVHAGCLFVTWHGEHRDGHDFCQQAVDQGAAALLVERAVDVDAPQIIVNDVFNALGQMTRIWRQMFDIPVIGVTGSNGKTTVKNMLKSIAESHYGSDHVVASAKSFNNHVGVPLTLARIDQSTRIAVIEMGMSQFNEIRWVSNIAQPTVTVINNAGKSHLAGVGGVDGVARAKAEILEGLVENGTAVLNADDPFYAFWYNQLGPHQRCLSFAMDNSEADLFIETMHVSTTGGSFRARTPEGDLVASIPLLGRHNLMNALAAAGCALGAGFDLSAIVKGLQNVEPETGRLNIHRLPQDTVVIDDSYNANPNSFEQSLEMIMFFNNPRTIVVMGDMRDLGEHSADSHSEVGELMYYKGVDYLVTYGEESQITQNKFQSYGLDGEHFTDRDALCYHLRQIVKPGDMVLFKASNSMQLGSIAQSLLTSLNDQLSVNTN